MVAPAIAVVGGLRMAWGLATAAAPYVGSALSWMGRHKLATASIAATGYAVAPEPVREVVSNGVGSAVGYVGGSVFEGATNLAVSTATGAGTRIANRLGLDPTSLSSAFNSAVAMDPTGGALALGLGIGLTKFAFSAVGMNMPMSGLANLTMFASLAYGAYKILSGESALGDLTSRTASPALVPAPSMSPMGG